MEVEKAESIYELYVFSKDFIPKLNLSKNAVCYYAEIAEQYAGFRLRQLSQNMQWMYTICFIHYRYKEIVDNLIVSFMYHIRSTKEASKSYVELAKIKHNSEMIVEFPKLAKFLNWFPVRDNDLNYTELNKAAYEILPKEQFSLIAKFLDGNNFDKEAAKWEFYSNSSRILSLYVRPIIMNVALEYYESDSKIMGLLNIIKEHYANGKTSASFKLADDLGLTVPQNMIKYLKKKPADELIDPHLFEFYVYEKIYHGIDRGKVFCNDSVAYCDIDQDLVGDNVVDEVEKIAKEFGYFKIPIYCDARLDDAVQELENTWGRVTDNINASKNPGFNLKETKSGQQDWGLLYDTSEKLDDAFFSGLPKVAIADMIMYIGNTTNMWDAFAHMLERYVKNKFPDKLAVSACILSEAFGLAIGKMGEMSDISVDLLEFTREEFIRVETLCAANDIVSNYICSLPIFKLWNLMNDKLLADADGQKMKTSENTIQSRYSKKYLGRGKGISIYTLVANFVAINAKNIGLNEYEGHFLYDMIYGNKTDVNIDMITGDNHSLNKLNFIALDSINVEYVPSIRNIREAANDLYSAKAVNSYSGLLQPKACIIKERVKSQKRGILRVLLSLVMQENTQANMIRKLNSHARYARLQAGLFEYNKIFKSIHVLNLIDDMHLRKMLRTARNRTEAYHQLQGLIRKIYHGIFRGKKIETNRISAHAARLVANCIVAYNSIILNMVYESMLRANVAQEIIDEFARISPIAWIHILFTGKYSFKKGDGQIDVSEMAKILEQHLKQSFWSAF